MKAEQELFIQQPDETPGSKSSRSSSKTFLPSTQLCQRSPLVRNIATDSLEMENILHPEVLQITVVATEIFAIQLTSVGPTCSAEALSYLLSHDNWSLSYWSPTQAQLGAPPPIFVLQVTINSIIIPCSAVLRNKLEAIHIYYIG